MSDHLSSSSGKSFGDPYAQALKKVMHGISKASKNTHIYPMDHTVSRNSINDLIVLLYGFTSDHGPLRLYLDKEGLYCLKDQKRVAPSEPSELAELLFRDGILWIEFKEKPLFPELSTFFSILKKYRQIDDDAEGDIVTALWEADLATIRYEATDIYWDIGDFLAFREMSEGPCPKAEGDGPAPAEEIGPADGASPPDMPQPAPPPSSNSTIWRLTKEEIIQLRRMVQEEEKWNKTGDVLQVLVGLLEEQHTEADFSAILDFIAEELQITLLNKNFHLADNLMRKLSALQKEWREVRPWSRDAMAAFFWTVSASRVLNVFEQIYPRLENTSASQLRSLQRFLLQLHPYAIGELAPLLTYPASTDIRNVFIAVIKKLAQQSFTPFEQVLLQCKEPMILCRLIPLLATLSDPQVASVVLNLSRHSNENVRMETMKLLRRKRLVSTEKLYHLIQDKSRRVRKAAVTYMGEERNSLLEKQLLENIGQLHKDDDNDLLACYRLLGRCGSSRSLAFLEKKLLGSPWKSMLGIDFFVERQGAALALLELQSKEAKALFEKAAAHPAGNIKKACEKAREIQDAA